MPGYTGSVEHFKAFELQHCLKSVCSSGCKNFSDYCPENIYGKIIAVEYYTTLHFMWVCCWRQWELSGIQDNISRRKSQLTTNGLTSCHVLIEFEFWSKEDKYI